MNDDTVTTGEQARTGTRGHKGRRRALVALPAVAVLLLAGCGDDGDDDDSGAATPTASVPAPATAAPSGPAAAPSAPAGVNTATFTADQQGAAKAYTTVLNPATPAAERVELIQDSDKLKPLIDAMLQSPLLGQVSASVKDVKVNGDTADVTFDILVNGQAGTLPTQTMPAVKDGDTWKVGAKTICTLGPFAGAPTPPECANY